VSFPLYMMFSYVFSMLFPHGLIIPGFGVVGGTGGSDAALAGGVVSSGTSVSPLPAISGDMAPFLHLVFVLMLAWLQMQLLVLSTSSRINLCRL